MHTPTPKVFHVPVTQCNRNKSLSHLSIIKEALAEFCLCVTHEGDVHRTDNWELCSSLQHFVVRSMMDFKLLFLKTFFSSILTSSLLWSSCALSKQLLLHFLFFFFCCTPMWLDQTIYLSSHIQSYFIVHGWGWGWGDSGALNTTAHNIGRENNAKTAHFLTWSKWALQHLRDLDIQRPGQWNDAWWDVHLQYFLAKMYHEWVRTMERDTLPTTTKKSWFQSILLSYSRFLYSLAVLI